MSFRIVLPAVADVPRALERGARGLAAARLGVVPVRRRRLAGRLLSGAVLSG